jgi:HemK-like putative methylase
MDLHTINEQEKKWLLDEKYGGIETPEYLKEAKQIDDGMPVAYLIGHIDFLGCRIELGSKPLIPRAETEYWTDVLIKEYKSKYSEVELRNMKVLDVFSGSGCIGIALAKHFDCDVDFAELKAPHIKQIKKNIVLNKIDPEKVHIYQSDVLNSVPEKKYDLIVANPPYVPFSHKNTHVQNSVNKHEDPEAVFAEDDGNELIKKLIIQSKEYLEDNREIWIEFDPSQSKDLEIYVADHSPYNLNIANDQYNKNRVLILKYI